jgi:hypothetical protein
MGGMGYPCLSRCRVGRHVSDDIRGMEKEVGGSMNWQGWIFMLAVWGFVSGLFFYSFYHILFDDRIQAKRKKSDGKQNG